MSKIGDQGAFPSSTTNVSGLGGFPVAGGGYGPGMSYRQWLIGMALQGMLCHPDGGQDYIAKRCVEQVDALLAEMEKS